MLTDKLSRISCISAKGIRVQNLACLIDMEMLKLCYKELDKNKAAGIDKVTKEEYGKHLDENIEALISRMKGGTYSPKPSKRVYIDKPGTTKKRPLGISCFEDKIVERAINKILVAIYEPIFLDCSYGFRPDRCCHQAISELLWHINGRTSFIVEADIRSCFDTIDHNWMITFLEHDIADRKFIELIRRGLKAGHFEDNIYIDDLTGTVQGSGYSPTLANVYLHYVLDTWFQYKTTTVKRPEMRFRGEAHLVRYADDFVCCFQYKDDAVKFFDDLKLRFGKYGFALAEEKTRVIEFGRFAQSNLDKLRTKGLTSKTKPDTFDFLGFTFYCSTNKSTGKFAVKVKSIGKRVKTKLAKIKDWLKKNHNASREAIFSHINDVLRGYFNYYAVTCNSHCVQAFRYVVIRMLFKHLNRRSQRRSYNWQKFKQVLKVDPIVEARIKVNIYTYRNRKAA